MNEGEGTMREDGEAIGEDVACEQSAGMDSPLLFWGGLLLLLLGLLPYLGVGVMSQNGGSWAFAIGLAMGFRGYTGGCLSGLIPGVNQCNVDADGSNR
jgi:hypothetical protein